MNNFKQLINPHQHSHYSIDGASSIKTIVKRSKELGVPYVAITEHGNLNSGVELYHECKNKKNGLKPILGIELYLEPPFMDEIESEYKKYYESINNWDEKSANKIKKKLKDSYTHLTVHFKDEEAYLYFCRLTPKMEARAISKWGETKPICTIDELAGISGHVTICSSCLMGACVRFLQWEIDRAKGVSFSRPDLAEKMYHRLKEIAGDDNFFLEIFPTQTTHNWKSNKSGHGCFEAIGKDLQLYPNQFVLDMAKKNNDKIIISLDSHFAYPHEKIIQDAKLGNGENQWKFHESYHIKSTDECATVLKQTLGVSDRDIEEWVDNSYLWASRFDHFKLTTNRDRWSLPVLEEDSLVWLKKRIDYYGRMQWDNPEWMNRLKFEITTMKNKGGIDFIPYLKEPEDIARYCKETGILMNVRGCLSGETLVNTGSGYVRLDQIHEGDFVLTHSGSLKKVLDKYEYDISEKCLTVETFGGAQKISMTSDHKVFAITKKTSLLYPNNKNVNIRKYETLPQWVRCSDLAVGDWLVSPKKNYRKIIDVEKIKLSDYCNYPQEGEFLVVKKSRNEKCPICIRAISRETKVSRNSIYYLIENRNKLTESYFKSKRCLSAFNKVNEYLNKNNIVWESLLTGNRSFVFDRVRNEIEIDYTFCYLAGKWAGDGWLIQRDKKLPPSGIGFAFNSSDVIEIKRTVDYFESLGCQVTYNKSKTKKLVQVYVNSKPIGVLFQSLFSGYLNSSKTKNIKWFLKLPDEKIRNVIDGLISADGHKRKDGGQIVITTTSRQLMLDVRFCLRALGIFGRVIRQNSRIRGSFICNETYTISFYYSNKAKKRTENSTYFLHKVSKISENSNVTKVYDICVEDDHSYQTVDYAVHNSAAGSLLLFLLGVSGINPLKYDLNFERFITPGRLKANTPPDVDMDFGRRDVIFDYLKEKHGDRFVQLSIDTKLKLKSSIKDAERFFYGEVRKEAEDLCKKLPTPPQGVDEHGFVFGYTDDDGNHINGILETNDLLKKYVENYPEVWNITSSMLGIIRQKSQHACGTLILPEDAQNYAPTMLINGIRVCGLSPKSAELAGLIKFDVLSVTTLYHIEECLKLIKARHGIDLDIYNLESLPEVFQQIALGEVPGVFQLDTNVIAPFLKKIPPTQIIHIINLIALGRPGTLDAPSGDGRRTLADLYVDRVNGESIEYIHPDLEPILKETYGILLFQEQSLRIFRDIGGMTYEEAEVVRRAIGKKERETLLSATKILEKTALARGWTNAQINLLIEQIMASAKYSFNKSHAVAYGVVSYACAYLLTKYRIEWFAALLSGSDKNKVMQRYWGYVSNGAMQPDINKSDSEKFKIENERIYCPLKMLSGIGEKGYAQLVRERPYSSIEDFISKHFTIKNSAIDRGVSDMLIASGLLTELFPSEIRDTADQIHYFNVAYARIREEQKVRPVPPAYQGMTQLGQYLSRKQIMPTYSEDLRKIMLPKRGGSIHPKSPEVWLLTNGVKCVDGDRLALLKELAEKDQIKEWEEVSLIGYVIEETVKDYQNKSKTRTILTVDFNGVFEEIVIWPPYGENDSPTGFKKKPTLFYYQVVYSKKNRQRELRLKSAVPLISTEQLETYCIT